tara:strand:+ start:819 stop:1253 length:435 start_codon:yes stop_codon:yes gene_type:complete
MRKLNLYDVYDDVVLSYKTDHKFHGAKRIEIEGTVILNKIVVEYPAKINGEFGILAFDQPIDAPLYQNYIPQPFPLFVGGTEQFDHLMFNGPDYFKIRVDEYKPWMYIGNIYDSELDITPVYKYYRQENDLHKLETLWKRNSSY